MQVHLELHYYDNLAVFQRHLDGGLYEARKECSRKEADRYFKEILDDKETNLIWFKRR